MLTIYSLIFMALMIYEGRPENADPVTAIYWVITTLTTLGYGDIIFYSPAGRIFSAVVVTSGVGVLFALIIPVVVTPWLDKLSREMPSRPKKEMSDHIIICGYSPTVEVLINKLFRTKTPFLIVERREDVARSIRLKYPIVFGDPSDPQVLIDSGVKSARLLVANEKEEQNADVIMTAREISNLEVIALVDDLARSRFLCYAGASRVISPKSLLGTFIAQIATPPKKGVFPGSIQLFEGLILVELPIYPGSCLIGELLSADMIKETGANIIGIWQKGKFLSSPDPEEIIRSNSVLMAVGDADQLSKVRSLTTGPIKEGHLVIIGFGDVGRRIVKVLCESDVHPVVVDRRDLREHRFRHAVGDGTSEDVLVEAGIKDAIGILVMLNSDADVIYATLMSRNLNPEAFIIARANHVRSAEKIYRAGADYVASVPIIASHMLARIIKSEEEDLALLYEDVDLIKFTVTEKSILAGKSLDKINLPARFGCTVVAVDRDGKAIAGPGPELVLEEGDVLAIIGESEEIDSFIQAQRRRLAPRITNNR